MSYESSKYNPSISVYNLTESSFRIGRAALAQAVVGGGTVKPVRILCLGDSITQGVTSKPFVNFNWPKRMRDILTASGRFGTLGEGMVFNTASTAYTRADYDPRWSVPANWTRDGAGIAGGTGFAGPGGAGTLTFSPGVSCDTFEIYSGTSQYGGSAPVTVGTASITLNSLGPNGVGTTTIYAGSVSAAHVLSITPQATNNANGYAYTGCYGIGYYTAGQRTKLDLITGGGTSGATTASINDDGNPWSPPRLRSYLGVDITLLCFGRNESFPQNNISVATYKANLTYHVARIRSTDTREVVLIQPPPNTNTSTLSPNDADYRAALFQVADTYDVAVIDPARRFGSGWQTGLYPTSTDGIHPNDGGMQAFAQAVASMFLL